MEKVLKLKLDLFTELDEKPGHRSHYNASIGEYEYLINPVAVETFHTFEVHDGSRESQGINIWEPWMSLQNICVNQSIKANHRATC